jgi:hypothetical protein
MTRGEVSRFRVTAGNSVVLDQERCPTDDYAEAFYLLEREFADGMLDRLRPAQLAVNNLKTLTATFAAYEAAAAGVAVPLTSSSTVGRPV